MASPVVKCTRDELEHLCRAAAEAAGASAEAARLLTHATLEAELRGKTTVGLLHLFDYLDGLRTGRVDGRARPALHRSTAAALLVDGRGGLAQVAFELARAELVAASRAQGIAVLGVGHTFTCGELGWYARSLTAEGLIAVVMCNSPALMSIGGSPNRVLGTNPLAYGVPVEGERPVIVDQASSQTAFVNVRAAAQRHESIPAGWAVDEDGAPTRDASRAVAGALLPFGGYKGGHIALFIELMVALTGARWAVDAPPFDSGDQNPGIGMVVVAIDPAAFDQHYTGRVASFLDRLTTTLDVDLSRLRDRVPASHCEVPKETLDRLAAAAGRPAAGT